MTSAMSSGLSVTGTFSQVYAELPPRPEAMAMDLVTASAERSLRSRPCSSRRLMNGSTKTGSRRAAMSSMARAVDSIVVREPGSS